MRKFTTALLLSLSIIIGMAVRGHTQNTHGSSEWIRNHFELALDALDDENGSRALYHFHAIAEYEDSQPLFARNAMWWVAGIYGVGRGGVSVDKYKQMRWLRKSAALGWAPAMLDIGEAYHMGLGAVEEDDEEALNWYQKAAEAGSSEAIYRKAQIYGYGFSEVVEQDISTAERLFLEAGERGFAKAYFELGSLYSQNDPWPELEAWKRDTNKALEYYQLAERAGYVKASEQIAELCLAGDAPVTC